MNAEDFADHLVELPGWVMSVAECVTQTYQDADTGMWWRYCLTCDDGSNKYRRHVRGHKTEADAQMSARDHSRAAYRNRKLREWKRQWMAMVLAAQTWEEFVPAMQQREEFYVRVAHWPRIDWANFPEGKRESTMAMVKESVRRDSDG